MTARAWLWLAVVLAELAALIAAVRHERRFHASPRFPVALLLAAAVVIDLAVGLHDPPFRWGLVALAAEGPRPRTGGPLVAYHLADALVLAWPALLATSCLRAFGPPPPQVHTVAGRPLLRRDPWRDATKRRPSFSGWNPSALNVLAGLYLGAVAGLVALHPLGARRTGLVLLAGEAVAVAVASGAIVAGWRRAVATERPWTRSHAALLVLVPVEGAVAVIGPFARENVFSAWDVARWQYLIAFVVVAALLTWPRRSTARR